MSDSEVDIITFDGAAASPIPDVQVVPFPQPDDAIQLVESVYGSLDERFARYKAVISAQEEDLPIDIFKLPKAGKPDFGRRLFNRHDGVVKLDRDVLLDQIKTQSERTEAEKGKRKMQTADWFAQNTPEVTTELKRDLQLLKMRNVIDPKRFYRKEAGQVKDLPETFEVGTVIADSTDPDSLKQTRKQQKRTIVEELLADTNRRAYLKRKAVEIDTQKRAGGKKFYRDVQARKSKR
ncbi:dTDP-fucopyranose mutase [Savitreella phatthalungensis]